MRPSGCSGAGRSSTSRWNVPEEPQERDPKADADKIAAAKERFEQCQNAEIEARQQAIETLEFLAGNQWPDAAKRERQRWKQPALVINRVDPFVRYITNAMKMNRVGARVIPVDDKADVQTAEVLQGLLRNIEYQSRAAYAYDTATFYAVAMGWGYWLLDRQFSHARTNDQDIVIARVRNPFQVYLDPSHANTRAQRLTTTDVPEPLAQGHIHRLSNCSHSQKFFSTS